MEYILSHKDGECIFCEKIASPDDEGNFVLERGRHSFVILNIYPYNTGHIMIAPNRHVASPMSMSDDEMLEIMGFMKTWERRIRKAYNPQAMNLGANIGAPAGAGVIGHFHIHVVPRWTGDTSHMTVISNTKVMPQSLLETYEQLRSSMDGDPE
jgi:ATP adenylyltransferase